MEAFLKLENLSVGFKTIIASNINAEIVPGKIVALMGINGVGKSCLLKTIAGLNEKKEGKIFYQAREREHFSIREFATFMSLVLTEKIHVDYLRVSELISFGRSPYTGWTGKLTLTDSRFIEKIMEQIGIYNLKENFFSELSDGQKQKVLIARALAQEPKLIILDEPTTFLDIPSKIDLMKLLKKIAVENNVAVLFSTHDLELVEKYADQIWLLKKSGYLIVGSPAELTAAGEFKKHFYYNDN